MCLQQNENIVPSNRCWGSRLEYVPYCVVTASCQRLAAVNGFCTDLGFEQSTTVVVQLCYTLCGKVLHALSAAGKQLAHIGCLESDSDLLGEQTPACITTSQEAPHGPVPATQKRPLRLLELKGVPGGACQWALSSTLLCSSWGMGCCPACWCELPSAWPKHLSVTSIMQVVPGVLAVMLCQTLYARGGMIPNHSSDWKDGLECNCMHDVP